MERGLAGATLAIAVLGGAGCASPRTPAAGGRENLVLVVIDTLRCDHLPAYGYTRPTAPTLSRLAAEGALADAVSPTSWTKPAVASILTGLHPLRHRAIAGEDVLPASAETLAELLKARGYTTLGITANGFVGTRYGFAQGFDEYITLPERGFGRFEPAATVNRILSENLARLRPPYFLYVHYLDPHAPYEPMSAGESWRLSQRLLTRRTPVTIFDIEEENFMTRPPELMRDAIDQYDGEILRVDDAIAEILGALRRRGLETATLVAVVSDHGEEMQEHGRMGHGKTLYEEVVRVPLVLWAPGVVAAGSRHGTVSLLDLAPTLLDLLGAGPGAAGMDGIDLAAPLRSGRRIDGSDRELLLHLDSLGGQYLAVRTDGWKAVLGRGPHRKEVFDLGSDPGEHTNLLATPAGRQRFAAAAERIAKAQQQALIGALAPEKGKDDAETREALAALGYLGSGGRVGALPSSLRAPDDEVDGLLGWEDVEHFQDCVEPSAAATDEQLLGGWYGREHDGRWTWPEATTAFRLAGAPRLQVKLSGRNPGPRCRLRVELGHETVYEDWVEPGPLALTIPIVKAAQRGVRLLRIQRIPAEQLPPRPGQQGRRLVGFFVRSLCVEPAR